MISIHSKRGVIDLTTLLNIFFLNRSIILTLIITAFFTLLPNTSMASTGAQVKVNGQLCTDMHPIFLEGRILVPYDQISTALGLEFSENEDTVSLSKNDISVEFTAESKVAWSGDKVYCLDVLPQILNDKLYVPLRFLCETIGANVIYSRDMVEIQYPFNRTNDIVLNFAGDTTLAWVFEEVVGDDFNYPFADAAWFGQADLTMVNLENAITERGCKVPKQFNFRMPPKYLQVLSNGGIDIVNLANNHVWDYGPVGASDTITYLDEAGIKHVGGGETAEQERVPVIIEVKGKRIGFLGYYDWSYYVEYDVRALKEKVDLVVVNFHWGIERYNYPEYYQIDLAHRAIDAGANVVVGHHPHVLQGVESYNGGIIAYSLGNFVFGGNSRRQHDTIVLQVVVRGDEIIPVIIPVSIIDWQLHWLTGEEGRGLIETLREYSNGLSGSVF